MPCNSDHLAPNVREKESLKIISLLEELGEAPSYYDVVYGLPKKVDELTAQLCDLCQQINVEDYSLELQIWWRDHQEADRQRVLKEFEKSSKEKIRQKALSKLSDYEKELLGL